MLQCAVQAACVKNRDMAHGPGAHGWGVLCVQSCVPSSASPGDYEFPILRAAVLTEPDCVNAALGGRSWARLGLGSWPGCGETGNWERLWGERRQLELCVGC